VVEITYDAATASDAHVLTYPFPATRVLELLEKLSGELDSLGNSAAPNDAVAPRPAVVQDRWALAESLRTLRAVRNDNLWMVARDGAEPVLWLRGDGSTCFATDAFVEKLRSDVSVAARLELRDGYPPPKTRVRERPGAEFFWHAGFGAGEILAPWLNATRRHRISAWPDFGAIRPESGVLRAAAVLASEAVDLQTLATRARVPLGLASRVCNALSLCELLVASETVGQGASKGASIAQPRGGFSGFLRKLRSHLGLGEAA
jgi:hypothetical protein